MMTTSTIQLRHQLQHTTSPNHRSSLTLYTQEKNANTLLPCLAERKIGGKVAIVPSKMTNGVNNSRISEPIDIKETQKTTNQKRGGKIYVSSLETSLSTTWKRSLSQESDKRDINNGNLEIMASQNPAKAKKRNERNKVQSRVSNGNNIGTCDNIDLNSRGGKEKGKRKVGKRLERQDSNVSIQLAKGKQLSFSSEGKSSISSHSETNLSSLEHCISNVYIKGKSNQYKSSVLIQKSPLCRSITISEASLSSALNRQAKINIYSKPISSRTRNSPRYVSGISIQNRNKRSFTISNDTTDGRLRTIYESTLEEHAE